MTKVKDDIFKTVETLSGGKIDILMCRGRNVLKIQLQQVIDQEPVHPARIALELMIDLCLVNGEKQDEEYYMNLLSEDYCNLSESIGEAMQHLRL